MCGIVPTAPRHRDWAVSAERECSAVARKLPDTSHGIDKIGSRREIGRVCEGSAQAGCASRPWPGSRCSFAEGEGVRSGNPRRRNLRISQTLRINLSLGCASRRFVRLRFVLRERNGVGSRTKIPRVPTSALPSANRDVLHGTDFAACLIERDGECGKAQ